MSAAVSDRRLLRKASLVIALQTGVAVGLVVSVVVAMVYLVGLEARRDATESKVRSKVANAETYGVDLDSPNPMIVDGLPAECPERDVREAATGLPTGQSWIEVCGGPFLAYVGEVDGNRVTAVVSFLEQQEETERLTWLSLLAGALGVLAAAGLGWAFGRRAVRPLGEALASQRRFVADASHELRTPLAIVLTRAQLLERGPAHDAAQRQELQQLTRDAKVAAEVVDDLLLVAEIQHRPPARASVDLNAVALDVQASFASRAELAGVDLVVDARTGADHVVIGTVSALRRAVWALVDNALAHVSQGGRIMIALQSRNGEVGLAVVDDGEGLDPARALELTKRFSRGSQRRVGGMRLGLGLALVSEIVSAHGGTLTIDGALGSGATFALWFPAAGARRHRPAQTVPTIGHRQDELKNT